MNNETVTTEFKPFVDPIDYRLMSNEQLLDKRQKIFHRYHRCTKTVDDSSADFERH